MGFEILSEFKERLKKKDQVLHDLVKNGRKVIGYFCTYTPIEMIHAAGFIPVRVMGESETLSTADMHVPGFTCPYLKKAFASASCGSYGYISGIIQGYTCDAACGLINIWKENIGGALFHTVPLPYNDNEDARAYLRHALEEFAEKLQSIGGQRIDSAIGPSVNLYASIRKMVTRLYQKRYTGTLPMSARDFYTIVQTGFVVPPEDYYDLLSRLIEEVDNAENERAKGMPVIITGSIIEELHYFDIIETSGGCIVGDDLCTGLRHFDQPDISDSDPIGNIIERHFKRMPCPARSRAVQRADLLKSLFVKTNAKGLICLFQKFCTPHLADYPVIRDVFIKESIPNLMLEMDDTGDMKGQIQTRLEGFFEIME